MKKLGIIIVLLIMGITSTQCTEDETVEAAQYKANNIKDGGGEEADDKDTEKDE